MINIKNDDFECHGLDKVFEVIYEKFKKEIINVASAVAKKAVGNSIDVNVQERLVDETLKEIGEGTGLS